MEIVVQTARALIPNENQTNEPGGEESILGSCSKQGVSEINRQTRFQLSNRQQDEDRYNVTKIESFSQTAAKKAADSRCNWGEKLAVEAEQSYTPAHTPTHSQGDKHTLTQGTNCTLS